MKNVRVVNKMRTMKCRDSMNLKRLHQLLGDTLHTRRPEMLVFPTSIGRDMQVFRNRTIQILGGMPIDVANTMCREFER